MKLNPHSLLIELEQELDNVHREHADPIHYCEHALERLHTQIEKLRTHLTDHSFSTLKQEAAFLGTIKPHFARWFLYYQEALKIEQHKPSGNEKAMRSYYKSALEKLQTALEQNLDLDEYFWIRNIYQDQYFTNNENDDRVHLDAYQHLITPEDFKAVSSAVGNLVKLHLEYELAKIDLRPLAYQVAKEENVPHNRNKGDTSH